MADGYLIALVRDSAPPAHPEDDVPLVQPDGAVLSERLTNYLTYDLAQPVTPPPLSLPRDPPKALLQLPPQFKTEDGWWRQSWPDSVTETAARSSEEDEEDEDDELFFYEEGGASPPTLEAVSFQERPPPIHQVLPSHRTSSFQPKPTTIDSPFSSADDLRHLANAIFLLSKYFCPNCTNEDRGASEEDFTVSEDIVNKVGKVDWRSTELTGPLTLRSALPVVLAFVSELQRLESLRHSSSNSSSSQHEFWILCAALAFQTRLQTKVHLAESDGPRKRACGVGCCRCPGFAVVERRIVSSICSRLLPHLNNNCSSSTVMQRDCSAALEIIQRFSVAVYIGSAWVDEQQPVSTGVIGGFLGSAFTALMIDGKCRRTKGTQLKRIAAATATTLYMSIVPCVSGAPPNSTIPCAICRSSQPPVHQHSSPYKSHSTQRALGATHPDFERKLFAVIEFVDCELRIFGTELERVADEALKILQPEDF